jgi:hypothetical protein
VELTSSKLKVQFQLVQDRFHCELLVRNGQGWATLLRSKEGSESTPWPPSPPWQQIVSEPLGKEGKSVLLGVGQSGGGHWSISIDEQDGGLLFDVACKTAKAPDFLGSTWELDSGWELRDVWSDSMVLVHKNSVERTVRLHASHGELSLKDEGGSNLIILHPLPLPNTSKPYRWALQVSAASA